MTSVQIAFPASQFPAPARTPAAPPAEGARFEDHLAEAALETAVAPVRRQGNDRAADAGETATVAPEVAEAADGETPDTAATVALAFAEIVPPPAILPAIGELGPSPADASALGEEAPLPAAMLDQLGAMMPAGAPSATVPDTPGATPATAGPDLTAGALAGLAAATDAETTAAPLVTPAVTAHPTTAPAAADESGLAALAGVLAEETASPLSAEIAPEKTAPTEAGAEPAKKRSGAAALDPLPETIVKSAPEAAPTRQAPQPVAAAAMTFVAALEKAKPEPAADSDALATSAAAVETRAQQAAVLAPGRPAVAPAQASIHVGVELARHAAAGDQRFQIRLDPPELGRVDVRLDLADDGTARAHLTVERRDTLDMLARDQRALERALREAGFETRDGALSFSLKDGGGNGRAFAESDGGEDHALPAFAEDEPQQPVHIVEIAYAGARPGTLDIRI